MTDPFVMVRCGGSRKTATLPSATSIGGTTRRANQSAPAISLSAPATRSSSDQLTETLPLFGDAPSTVVTTKSGSSVRSSATRVRTSHPSLSDRLTRSLITAGLVSGITPSSIRKLSGQPIRVLAFDTPGGSEAASPSVASLSLNDNCGACRHMGTAIDSGIRYCGRWAVWRWAADQVACGTWCAA